MRFARSLRNNVAFKGQARLSRLLSVGLVGVLTVAMVGSVLAATFETLTLTGSTQSNQYDPNQPPPGDIDLRIKSGPCAAGDDPAGPDFGDDTALTLVSPAEFDLASIALLAQGEALAQLGIYCIANAGPSIGGLDLSVISSSSMEVGTCGAVEAAAEQTLGHWGCADSDDGELHQYTNFQISGNGVGNCGYLWTSLDVAPDAQRVGTLAAGEMCTYTLSLHSEFFQNTTAVPDDRLASALTDTLLFDLEVSLSVI